MTHPIQVEKKTVNDTIIAIGKAITHQLHALSPNSESTEVAQLINDHTYNAPKQSEEITIIKPNFLPLTGC